MPAKQPKAAAQKQESPRSTAKYTSRDGSKFITVPKGDRSESSQPSTPTSSKPGDQLVSATPEQAPAPVVNRKKQKRRAKAAAKAAAQAEANGHPAPNTENSSRQEPADYEIVPSDEDEDYEYILASEATANGGSVDSESKPKKGKKKKKKAAATTKLTPPPGLDFVPPFRITTETEDLKRELGVSTGMSRDKIWSTSNHEERERIKQFWLNLGEDERKSLVKVEKDAVLKKMKEQQKHTCSCTVCGRKRTAIEEELEGLYDAYYVELEEFANQGEGPLVLPPSRDHPSHSFRGRQSSYPLRPPPVGRMVEHVGDEDEEDDLEEVYSENEVEDDEFSDDEPPEAYHHHNPHDRDVADFLTFGNSLQVKGGILTVADDLLKNDGKRFIEMMEQLAERRMAREEDAREHFPRGYGHPNGSYSNPHNHPPLDDDDYEEEDEEEEDYEDSQDDEYEDEEDPMTEEQRMEEGRRMFQIFAARMFEQRVLSAYKEKVAKERQEKLIEELEEETRKEDQQKAKKAKNAAKKKEKAAQKKQALAEEKARKEAEKAAEEAARVEAEKQKAAEIKRKLEEKRREKEAQRKAEEEAKLKREAERQRRIHEQQERQAEQERKAREAKEQEKKLKEEQRRQEKEARERKELEAQERKDKQERDKREKEARAAKAQKEAQEQREAKEKAKEEKAAQKAAAASAIAASATLSSSAPSGQPAAQTQPSPALAKRTLVSLPTVLPQHPPNPANFVSPKIPVATPVISKAPTPIRPRTTSQQHDGTSSTSQSASVTSQNASPHPETASQPSPGPIGPSRKDSSASGFMSHPSQSVSPQSNGHLSRGVQPTPPQFPPMGMAPPGLGGHHPPPPGFPGHHQMFPPGFRPAGNMMMPPPGINGPAGRGFPPAPMPPPGFTQGAPEPFAPVQAFPMPKEPPMAPPGHTRQGSTGFDGAPGTPLQSSARPAPIGRPGSNVSGRSREDKSDDAQHLGSRALLEDDDLLPSEPINIRSQAPGPRPTFAPSPFMGTGFMGHDMWAPPPVGGQSFPTAPPGFGGNPNWGAPGMPSAFGSTPNNHYMGPPRGQTGLVAVRNLLVQTYRDLAGSGQADAEGYVDFDLVRQHTDARSGEISVSSQELIMLTETEGNATNGGGTFDSRTDPSRGGVETIRWMPDSMDNVPSLSRGIGAPGQIGSPIVGSAAAVSSRGA